MKNNSFLKCIDSKCGKEYEINSTRIKCDCENLLDVKYGDAPSPKLQEVFYSRRNPHGNIFNESGVWRFRELLNFCQIDTEDPEQCSKNLVSLDGSEEDYQNHIICQEYQNLLVLKMKI